MKQTKKLLPLMLTVSLGLGITLPVKAESQSNGIKVLTEKKQDSTSIQDQITSALWEQGIKSPDSYKQAEFLVVTNRKDISAEAVKAGAKVDKVSESVYVLKISANKAKNLAKVKGIEAIGRDRMLSLPKPVQASQLTPSGRVAEPNLEYSNEVTGIVDFWNKGFDGRGTKVSIIDTGVEPRNELLTLTSEGKLKIVDWQDFWKYTGEDSEGDVRLTEATVQTEGANKSINHQNMKISLPDSVGEKVLVGFFDERKLVTEGGTNNHDVNNNGRKVDLFPVVVTNYSDQDKGNDAIFVDTNMNGSVADEQEMGIYKEIAKSLKDKVIFEMNGSLPVIENNLPKVKDAYKSSYQRLVNRFLNSKTGTNASGSEYNFVVTEVDVRDGQYVVNLGYDGNGHGSHVAGDAGANGYKSLPFVSKTLQPDGTLKGAAPGAQIIACRVFQSDGGTPQSAYLAAMEYSAENGADVVNMSLGSLPDINDDTDPTSVILENLGKKYGAIFAISAGNEGPSTNAVGTPGASEWAVTVGAYNPAWLNYGYDSVEDSLWYFSSRGPTEDGRLKPTILAPGSMISSMPMWFASSIRSGTPGGGTYVGYGLEQGTSMSSPYTAGTIAAIKQAINEKELPYHPLLVKEALFETGDKNINNKMYLPTEIGGGMINPNEALTYLENIKTKGLTQASLKSDSAYIGRHDLVVKSEFDYSEKLSYKPEGLYVRSGDIPGEVDVTITNTKNVNLELDLKKDSYNASNDWLTLPESKLSLKKGESKKLTLKINKDKLNENINSVLIKMDDPSTPIKEGFIPVTVINYMDLSASQPVVSATTTTKLTPGNTSKHFIRIPYGVDKVDVMMELQGASDPSTLLPFITAPSGIQATDIPGVDWITSLNNQVTVTLRNPEAGTWEFNLFSGLIDEVKTATGIHKVTAKIKGVAFGPSVIKYEGQSGEYIENDIEMKLLNATSNDTEKVTLVKTNLVSVDANKKVETKTITNHAKQRFPFTIAENDPNIFVRLQTSKVANAGDDLDIVLYKMVKDASGNLQKGGVINVSAQSGSDEEIYQENLTPGEYMLEVEAYETAPTTSYELSIQVANNSHGENVMKVKNENITISKTALADAKLGVRVPIKAGLYMGFISAKDTSGLITGKAKVLSVSKGTDNSVGLDMDELIRFGKDFQINLDGSIKDQSNLNNIYGIEFELDYDAASLTAKEVEAGDIFKDSDVKVLSKKIADGKITYAIGFLNTESEHDAMGAIEGNLSKIKLNAQKIGKVDLTFNKLLVVNHLGDEVAVNVIRDYVSFIVNPDLIKDGVINIFDISRIAYQVGKLPADAKYDAHLDLNEDGLVDYKDFNFIVDCFTEDQPGGN